MAVDYKIVSTHGVAFPSKMLAQVGGKHIYNIQVSQDMDNGMVVAKDKWQGMEFYSMKASTGVAGVVLQQADNGNWYVEITEPGDGLLLRNVPMIAEEWGRKWQAEGNFYNAKNDIVRGYEFAKGDIIELSADCFTGEPEAKATLSIGADYKWTVA